MINSLETKRNKSFKILINNQVRWLTNKRIIINKEELKILTKNKNRSKIINCKK